MELFGIHEKALLMREQRTELLAQNIANADTPNYKSRDMDFASMLNGQQNLAHQTLQTTHANHMSLETGAQGAQLKYRIPMQNSPDGNTVDSQIEQAQFSENAMHYMATLNFINQRASTIVHALKGD